MPSAKDESDPMNSLTVTQWHAWASGLETPEAWLAWFKNPQPISEDSKAGATQVPALMRRRLSSLGRAAIEAVMAIYDESDRENQTPIVFASRWGDIGLSVKLLKELCQEKSVSPMGFSTSVHNGIGGLFSISQKHRANIVAIAGAETTPSAAIFEAMGLLHEGARSVIVVVYEERSPEEFARFHTANFTYAWAVRLQQAKTDESSFTVNSYTTEGHRHTDTTESLNALRFLVEPTVSDWVNIGFPSSYRWRKC